MKISFRLVATRRALEIADIVPMRFRTFTYMAYFLVVDNGDGYPIQTILGMTFLSSTMVVIDCYNEGIMTSCGKKIEIIEIYYTCNPKSPMMDALQMPMSFMMTNNGE